MRIFLTGLILIMSVNFCFAEESVLKSSFNDLSISEIVSIEKGKADLKEMEITRRSIKKEITSNIISGGIVLAMSVWGFSQKNDYGNVCGSLFAIKFFTIVF